MSFMQKPYKRKRQKKQGWLQEQRRKMAFNPITKTELRRATKQWKEAKANPYGEYID